MVINISLNFKRIRTGEPCYDFYTLLRNMILIRLSYEGGFKIRTFISSNGKEIYSVLHLSERNLRSAAIMLEFNK